MIFIDCITDDFVQSETHLGYYYYYTGTRKDFISLLPKVKIYPTTRFLTGFSWLYLIIFVIIWVKSKNEVICDPTQLSDCCLLNFRSPRSSTTPLSQYFILTLCAQVMISQSKIVVWNQIYIEKLVQSGSVEFVEICEIVQRTDGAAQCVQSRVALRCAAHKLRFLIILLSLIVIILCLSEFTQTWGLQVINLDM